MWKYSASAEAAKIDQKVMNGDVLCQSIHDFDWRWNFQHCSKLNDSTTKNHRTFGVVLISGWNSLLSITLNGLNWSIFRSWSLFFGASFQWEGQLVGGGLPYPGNPGKWFCLQSPYIHPMPCRIIPITYPSSASCTKIYDTQFACEGTRRASPGFGLKACQGVKGRGNNPWMSGKLVHAWQTAV